MSQRSLQPVVQNAIIPAGFGEDISLITRTFAKGLDADELSLFVATAHSLGLSIVRKQIHAVKRGTGNDAAMTIQIGIDGYRSAAEHHPDYAGQDGPYWCGEDGVWKDVWLSKDYPRAAKVGILRKGFAQPLYAIALWDEYVQTYWDKTARERKVNQIWDRMSTLMLAKCAEALGIRKAFPSKLGGTYTPEEMMQADRDNAIETTARIVEPSRANVTSIAARQESDIAPADSIDGAIRRYEAAARQHDIDPALLILTAQANGYVSLQASPVDQIEIWTDDLIANPVAAKSWYDKRAPKAQPVALDPEKVMKHVHAAAGRWGITHEHLHNWATSMGHESLREVPLDQLDRIARRIADYPDTSYVLAEWDRFGWTTPADPETGEVIDVQVATPARTDRDEVSAALWRLAHDTFGWSREDLEAVNLFERGTALKDTDADGLEQTHRTIVVMSLDERNATLKAARAAIAD